MFSHLEIWRAIDMLAGTKGWSRSRLAIRAGLDPGALNWSKRAASTGKPRWPSTETISKLLRATGIGVGEFCCFIKRRGPDDRDPGADSSGG
jgi:transcriptional regulator with XRE-family HTH domain